MRRSKREFNRWKNTMKSTWAFQVYNKHNDELNEMMWANRATTKQTYLNLKSAKAKWSDSASDYLFFDVPKGEEAFENLKEWSGAYNRFNNWTNLNALLALTSNFETYLTTVVSLALESDPGILFESSKSIDGVLLLKKEAKRNKYHDEIISSITKGDWSSRLSAYKRTFGYMPPALFKNTSKLEKIRVLRNKIGHAFGRDIDISRNNQVKDPIAMEKLSDKQVKNRQYTIMDSIRAIDQHLLTTHIGEYSAIAFYHRIFASLRKDIHQSERAMILKKRLGSFGDISGKLFCKGLVEYYESL